MGRGKGHTNVLAPVRRISSAPATVSLAPERDIFANIRPRGPTESMRNGKIIIPRSQQEIDEIVARWRSYGPQPLAHDLECAPSPTVPNGTGLHPHLGTIRLAQFAIRHGERDRAEALVIDLWRHQPGDLLKMLASKDWLTIIHFAPMEARWLGYNFGLRIESLVDTWLAYKRLYRRLGFTAEPLEEDLEKSGSGSEGLPEGVKPKDPRFALGTVALRELGVGLAKEHQNSYWDAVRLTDKQLKYAGEDVLSLLDLFKRIEPLLNEEDWEALHQASESLCDKSAGITPAEARRRNAKLRTSVTGLPNAAKILEERRVRSFKPEARNCESERALRMIANCRNKNELAQVEAALPYLRIHFTNRKKVLDAIESRRKQIKRGTRKPNPVRVKAAGWEQPF